MSRKTIAVETVVRMVNKMNQESICGAEVRKGWNALCEDILHATDNYSGFMYLGAKDVPPGQLPGIDTNQPQTAPNDRRFPDETRVQFFLKK